MSDNHVPPQDPMPLPRGIKRGVYLLPNLCTTGNLFFGFFSVIKSLHQDFVPAAWMILIAGVFDLLDGRLARLARAESDFGIQYDAMADLISFGVAPAILMYSWSLASIPRLGWLCAFLFAACGALRLARFNVQFYSVEKEFFQGLPIPAAAGLVATTVLFYHQQFGMIFPVGDAWFVGLTILLALLMISTIRYRSFKQLNLRSRHPFITLVGAVGMVMLIAWNPEIVLFVLSLLFVVHGLVEEVVTMRQGRRLLHLLRQQRADLRQRKALRKQIHVLPGGGGPE